MAAFYTDAVPVAKQASWALSGELERLGMEGDMYSVGVDVKDAANIISAFKDHLDVLNDYRLEKLQSSRQSML